MGWPVSARRTHAGNASAVVGSESAYKAGWLEQVARRDPEGVSQGVQVVYADVPFAPFNASDVGAVQVGQMRESFLGQLALGTQRSEAVTEGAAAFVRLLLSTSCHAD